MAPTDRCVNGSDNSTGAAVAQNPPSEESNGAFPPFGIAGICICILVLVGAAVITGVCLLRKRKKVDVKKSGSDPPDSYLKELINTDTRVDLEGLRAETKKILDDDPKTAEELLSQQIMREDSEWMAEVVRGGLGHVEGCRYPMMEIRRDSQLTLTSVFPTKQHCLHMSKLSDYNGKKILISQAPKRVHFAYHWRAIWQEKIGVVVWMGDMGEGALRLMDNYIELFAGDQAIYGPFRAITTSAPRKLPDYDEYRVTVRFKGDERKLIFINDHVWPLYGQTTRYKAVADLVQHISAHQRDQAVAGLPGILFHGSTGIERDPAIVSVYIGYQMWLDERHVNLIGIMRYVRHQRWLAFSRPNSIWHIKTAFATMLELAERAEKDKTEGSKSDHQKPCQRSRSCQRRVEERGRATG